MKKIMLVGRSGAGKTTLTQAMKGKKITYHKTQYINNYDVIIDTPGEYAENKTLARALVIYSYEADVVGLLINSEEPYSLYPPNIVGRGRAFDECGGGLLSLQPQYRLFSDPRRDRNRHSDRPGRCAG